MTRPVTWMVALCAWLVMAACSASPASAPPSARTAPPAAHAPAAAAAPAAFSKADEQASVSALSGEAVAPGSSVNTMSGSPEKVEGYFNPDRTTLYEVLLSKGYQDAGGPKHALVVGAHEIEDGEIRSVQAQYTEVSAAILEPHGGKWSAVASAPALGNFGQYGHSPKVSLEQFGPTRYAIRVDSGAFFQGNTLESVEMLEPVGAKLTSILDIHPSANDESEDRPSFSWEGTLEMVPGSGTDAYDLRLTIKGTYRNEAGKVLRFSGPILLRLQGGVYKPVDAGAATAAQWKALTGSPW